LWFKAAWANTLVFQKYKTKNRTGGVAQVVEHLPNMSPCIQTPLAAKKNCKENSVSFSPDPIQLDSHTIKIPKHGSPFGIIDELAGTQHLQIS
jgi:hypothetical protein